MSELENKNVIITGGSGGIGRVIANMFLKEGSNVLLVSRSQEELESAYKELSSLAEKLLTFAADVSNIEEVKKLRAYIDEALESRVDVLVNAAGIYGPIGALDSLSEDEIERWLDTLRVNVFGTALMSHVVVPFMKKNGGGRIINFSGGGEGAFPNFTAYSSSKGAVVRFTESHAKEVEDYNIFVNAIAPGAVNTALMEQVLAAGPERVGEKFYKQSIEQKESGGTSPDKAADLIRWLCSGDADGISGKMLSAKWDDLEKLTKHKREIQNSDIYTNRRIKPEDKLKDW